MKLANYSNMQKFKFNENPSFFSNFVSDPTSMKCQIFIDAASMLTLGILLAIAGAVYGNFSDNFLPGFYLLKLIYLAFVYIILDESKKNCNKKFLGARIFFDLLMFVGGYFMMQQSKIDEMCYILYCSVILLNLSASTICVLVMGQDEVRDDEVYVQDNEGI